MIKYSKLLIICAATFLIAQSASLYAAPQKETASTAQNASTKDTPEKSTKPAISGLAGIQQSNSKLPTFVKSDSLSLKSEARTFTYSGNVEVTQGDMTLTAQTMDGFYDENNKIKQLIAKGNVLITKGPQIRATGERGIYDADTDTVVLTEDPELQQDGSILSADRIRVFLSENRSVAEGTVRVKLIQKDKAAVDTKSALKSQK